MNNDFELDFEKLKDEFTKCSTPYSSEEQEPEEDYSDDGSFIRTVQKNLLPPEKCGVYLSRLDIKVIGLKFNEDVQIRERKRMIRDILRAITTQEDMREVFGYIKETVDEKLQAYDELVQNFPATKEIFEDKKQKAQKFKRLLDNLVENFDEEIQ